MKFLLAALNAKYIHSNPAVYSLAAYAGQEEPNLAKTIAIAEYTINQSVESILADLYHQKPTVVGFSCYIWNIEYVYRVTAELKKILPDTEIWLGGPEVSFDPSVVLAHHPEIKGVMVGEGEATFTELLVYYSGLEQDGSYDFEDDRLRQIHGIVIQQSESGAIPQYHSRKLTDLSTIPFLYHHLETFEHKIIYYESSRGCPFRCSYCLSSIDKKVRFRDIEVVKKELQFFLDHNVKQVKFVDRTFNCSHAHAMEIWKFIKEHDNGITNFHFEIAADILNDEEIALIQTFRPGAVQMEIGVQSTNICTVREIDRTMDVTLLTKIVEQLHAGGNVHLHLDLIAGLPYEDYESFRKSFNDVFAMKPEQLQLGFLKVLKGSKMHDRAQEYGIAYTNYPPYEVLYTKWLSYDDVLKLKKIEEMVELYYNSNQFQTTLPFLLAQYESPFALFEALAEFYEANNYFVQTPARMYRYQILIWFAEAHFKEQTELIRQMLVIDYYMRENAKAYPEFAKEMEAEEKTYIRNFWQRESKEHQYLTQDVYVQAPAKNLARMAHIQPVYYDLQTGEILSETAYLLFDYENRSPLTYEAKTWWV